MHEIILLLIWIIAGLGMLFITMLAVGRIASEINFYFAAPLLIILYAILLAVGALYWPLLGPIVTVILWGSGLLLAIQDWLKEKRQNES